jgi:hypothetical protein
MLMRPLVGEDRWSMVSFPSPQSYSCSLASIRGSERGFFRSIPPLCFSGEPFWAKRGVLRCLSPRIGNRGGLVLCSDSRRNQKGHNSQMWAERAMAVGEGAGKMSKYSLLLVVAVILCCAWGSDVSALVLSLSEQEQVGPDSVQSAQSAKSGPHNGGCSSCGPGFRHGVLR